MDNPYDVAGAFAKSFGDAEYALKRSGRLRQNKDVAEADWDAFARDLGADFFPAIVDKGIAKTLIGEPPRRLMNDLEWAPEIPKPFTNVHELIVQGVCRVRNSYLHGEKFKGGPDGQWERDVTLIKEAQCLRQRSLGRFVPNGESNSTCRQSAWAMHPNAGDSASHCARGAICPQQTQIPRQETRSA